MVRVEVIRKRLNKLDEYLSILKNMKEWSYKEFISDPEKYGSVERFLQLSIEAINDIGNHIIADLELGTIDWYSDIPKLLNQKGYINDELKNVWIRMIGFRNILVHDYVEIDRKIVFDTLQNNLDDFKQIEKALACFL